MRAFKCCVCGDTFRTAQKRVRQWPIEKWWQMVAEQCANCRVESQGEPDQRHSPEPAAPQPLPSSETSFGIAREELMKDRYEGVHCPLCDQFAKVYKRKLNATMVRSLATMYQAGGITEFVHTPSLLGGMRGEEARLSYWGLTLESAQNREDGGRRGWWKVTPKGELFLDGFVTVPRYALIYNSECLALDGEPMSVRDALGESFNLRELMTS